MIMIKKPAFFNILFLMMIFILPIGAEETEITKKTETADPTEEIELSEEAIKFQEELLSDETIMAGDVHADLTEEPSKTQPVDYDDFADFDDFFFTASEIIIEVPPFEPRSFDEIFPRLSKRVASNGTGYRSSFENGDKPSLIPSTSSGIDLLSSVMSKEPSHIIEALILIPYNERELDMLDIYNALSRIENIKDQTLPSSSGKPVQVFKETTRLKSASDRKAIPDPEPASRLPYSDTMYIRFTDSYIGSLFLRGDMSLDLYGITYNMTNFRDINFTIFRIMKAEKVAINIYLEPTKDGILVYSVSGINLPGFIMKRLNLTPNINARIRVLMQWITEGLRKQEGITVDQEREDMINKTLYNYRLNRMLRENAMEKSKQSSAD